MTLATASSFLSSPPGFFALVLAASFSDAVAPKHKAKSMVEDWNNTVSIDIREGHKLTFCLLNSSSTRAEGTIHPPTLSTNCDV